MAPVRAAVALVRASRAGRCGCRGMSTATTHLRPPPQEIAVLGGGLTGLVTAHYLATKVPGTTRITVYERSDRLGGWIESPKVDGSDGVFEAGARTVAPQRRTGRYDDVLLLGLVAELGLADQLRVTRQRAAQYIYYPDHLVQMPGGGSGGGSGNPLEKLVDELTRLGTLAVQAFTEPVFRGVVPLLLRAVLSPASTAQAVLRTQAAQQAAAAPGMHPPDVSVADYALWRLGAPYPESSGRAQADAVVDNVLSAVAHGIYGGDVRRLSVASSPLRSNWLGWVLTPLLERYALRMQYSGLARKMYARGAEGEGGEETAGVGGEDSPDADTSFDAPLQRPIPEGTVQWRNTQQFMAAHSDCAFVAASDLLLLEDLTARTQGRPLSEAETAAGGRQGAQQSPAMDLLVRLALASPRWTSFGFAGGMQTLTDALAASLRHRANVRIVTGAEVAALDAARDPAKVYVQLASGAAPRPYDRVVSTLAAPVLRGILRTSEEEDHPLSDVLDDAHAVTIMVVNLAYDAPALNAPYHGFGYLIPQSVPLEQNPEMALGVLFDSDREALLERWDEEGLVDESPPSTTKLTVLLGGHYWDDYADDGDYPSPDAAVAMALAVVRRHLRDTPLATATPTATRAKLCRQCIPQHYVGHSQAMEAAHWQLAAAFGDRLAVAGGSFTATGPGVLSSVRSAYDVALHVAGRGYRHRLTPGEQPLAHVGDTGLARFGDAATDPVVPWPRRYLPLRFGNRTRRDPETGTWAQEADGREGRAE